MNKLLPPNGVADPFVNLLCEAQAGSDEALGRLLIACQPFLLATARRKLPIVSQAEVGASDLVQETFGNAEKAFGDFRGSTKEALLAWLHEILDNELKKQFRKEKTKKRDKRREVRQAKDSKNNLIDKLPADQSTPSGLLLKQESMDKLHDAVAKLPEDYQQVIHLHSYERLGWKEVGERLGRSPDSARKLWTRAFIKLQHHMSPNNESRR